MKCMNFDLVSKSLIQFLKRKTKFRIVHLKFFWKHIISNSKCSTIFVSWFVRDHMCCCVCVFFFNLDPNGFLTAELHFLWHHMADGWFFGQSQLHLPGKDCKKFHHIYCKPLNRFFKLFSVFFCMITFLFFDFVLFINCLSFFMFV